MASCRERLEMRQKAKPGDPPLKGSAEEPGEGRVRAERQRDRETQDRKVQPDEPAALAGAAEVPGRP